MKRRAASGSAIRTVGAFVALATLATVATPSVARADQEPTVKWNDAWPRVHLVEVADIALLTVASIEIDAAPYADHAKWSKPILLDGPIRDALHGRSEGLQQTAADFSDYFYKGMVLAPYVVDNYIVALGVHQNADVALQMTLIDMQSLGLSGVMSLAAEHLGGRARPYVQDCTPGVPNSPDKVGFNHCDGIGDFQSFYSGHAAATFTMASLTCLHHQHLPLYGGGVPDALVCAGMVSLASATGLFRIIADRHWASDVWLGATVGFLNGYVLPAWLHYGFGDSRKKIGTVMKTSWGYIAPAPAVYPGGGGLSLAGAF